MKVENTRLFMKYALPCADTLIERGEVSQSQINKLIKNIINNEELPKDSEKIFKVAYAMCTIIGKKLKKKRIDDDVIRRYFLYEHDKVVDLLGNKRCKVYPGKVVKVGKDSASILTPLGKSEYRTDFAKNLKEGDFVSVHREFIVEKISEDVAKELWEIKEAWS